MTSTVLTGAPTLDRRAFAHITPNWFASVMGTGIVATAASSLPLHVRGLHNFAVTMWVLAALLLVVAGSAFLAHWVAHLDQARSYAAHPVMSQFYGAPPMALLTVGAGTLLLGKDIIGIYPALCIAWVLWTVGTALGLATSVVVPLRSRRSAADTVPAMLMPVVPPMVSASTGALLLPHLAGEARFAMLLACYAMFGWSLVLGGIVLVRIYRRMLRDGRLPVQSAPTIWITLGVVGQSITAVNLLGSEGGWHAFGLIYGVVAGAAGAAMFAVAVAVTAHAARSGLRFSLTWWSFTFPIGTCVTGATALGTASGIGVVHALAVGLFGVLCAAWAVVATHTVRGLASGRLLLPA